MFIYKLINFTFNHRNKLLFLAVAVLTITMGDIPPGKWGF